ncbi:TPA: 30S ribosomal protein S27e [Candidatus Micrarchaeota archaeon]|nr:MAG: 30S ribosomal protein S27e [Candidatus Micrarchaeota archaeon CG1_02_51_15]HII39034.1 30S ribosomal protein S27e [Candidatus Micrarchaeota archaeon]
MSRFLHVECDCGGNEVVFGDAKMAVSCLKCGKVLIRPQGGRARIDCKILEVL